MTTLSTVEVSAVCGLHVSLVQLVGQRLVSHSPLNRSELRAFRKMTRSSGSPRPGGYRRFWFRWPRRSGKTSRIGAPCAVAYALAPNPTSLAPGESAFIIASAPTRELCRTWLDTCAGLLEQLGEPIEKLAWSIRLPRRNTIIEVATGDQVSGRGKTAKLVVVEEAGGFPSDATAVGNLQDVMSKLAPTLATSGGPMLLIGTPLSKNGFFNASVERLLGNVDGDDLATTCATWAANPDITEKETHALEPNERAWKREWLAEPDDDEGAALESDDIAHCVRDLGIAPERITMALDQSGGKGDPYATSGAGRVLYQAHPAMPAEDLIVVVRELTRQWKPSAVLGWVLHKKVADEVALLARRWHAKVLIDSYGGNAWMAELASRGVRVEQVSMAPAAQMQRFKLLAHLIHSRRLVLPNDRALLQQLRSLREIVKSDGRVVYDVPRSRGHDDLVDALAVCVEAASKMQPSGGNIQQRVRLVRNADGRPCGFEKTFWTSDGMPCAPPPDTAFAADVREQHASMGITDVTDPVARAELEQRERTTYEAYSHGVNIRVRNQG